MSGTAARRALFEAERGVCQLCSLDAHSLFLSIRALHVRDRPAYLAQTPYASLPQQTLKKMVMEPKEGMVRELYQNIASGKKRRRLGRAGLCFFSFANSFACVVPSSPFPSRLRRSFSRLHLLARARSPTNCQLRRLSFLSPLHSPSPIPFTFLTPFFFLSPSFPPSPLPHERGEREQVRKGK